MVRLNLILFFAVGAKNKKNHHVICLVIRVIGHYVLWIAIQSFDVR